MATGHSNLKENEQQQIVERRIGRLWSHLGKLQSEEEQQQGLGMEECAGGKKGVKFTVSSVVLADYLKGEHRALQERMILYFKDHPELQTPVEICKEQHRELVLKQLKAIVKEVGIRPLRCVVEDPAQYFAIGEAAGLVDLSLGIKLGVQYSLWGGSVMNLGTRKHRDKYYEKIENLDYLGCFAMTELHHGSNVQGLQTTATFDLKTDEFIINTPNEGAAKWWIGNAAVHGKFATVFCRLILPDNEHQEGVDMGVHAFIVPIRDMETHKPLPGVEIRDCGYKIGLNGVDNGALKFNSVRIPRDNLLNRFGDVSKDGQYTSSLPTINKRFAATVGELTGGRVALAKGSVGVLQAVVTIAVRFSLLRQQFGPPKQSEISILDYQSQQHKLMPMLATAYAFHFAGTYLVDKYSEMKKTRDEVLTADVHALSAGLKAYITSYTAKATSICRESCGGHGYAAANRFGSLRNDHDIFQTFEGDNTVLLQQVAADLLKRYKEKFQGGTLNATWIYLSDAMTTYLSEANPVVARREGQDHLRDPKFHLDAFRYRTSRLLHTVALRLQKHTKTLGGFQAWNRCLNHLLTVAESHVESIILERFIEAVNSCKDRNSRAVLKLLCDLYALDRIWKDIGTYRNVDYVAPNKAKAIHRLTERLSFDVRSVARELVDAFGFPDFMLRAPIGMQSGQYTEYTTSNVGF